MASKKFMGVLLSLAMVFSMTACGKSEETKKKTKKTKETVEQTEDETEEKETETTKATENTLDTKDTDVTDDTNGDVGDGILDPDANIGTSNYASGVLRILPDSYDGFLGGLYLSSPSSGTKEMNKAGLRQAFIRSVFENTDHIEIYLASDASNSMSAYLVPHHDDASIYTVEYMQGLPEEIIMTHLTDPHDPEWYWGDLSLNEETYAPGYYDILFTDYGEPVGTVTIQLVSSGTLSNFNDYEYYTMIKEDLDSHNMAQLYDVSFDKFYGCSEQGIWPDEYTWSGSGLPTLPCENTEADISLNTDETTVCITSKLINEDEESCCVMIDDVFTANGYEISYPDGDSDANYRYVYVFIEGVPCQISYYGYNGELHLDIVNLIATA